MPHIPEDIVDNILESVSDDSATLLACALVARSWLPVAQRYIYRDFTISVYRPDAAARACTDLLTHLRSPSPHPSKGIKNISLILNLGSRPKFDPPPMSLALERVLSLSLSIVERPRKLRLSFCNWSDIPPSLSDSLNLLFAKPSFEELFLDMHGRPSDTSTAAFLNSNPLRQRLRYLSLNYPDYSSHLRGRYVHGPLIQVNLPHLERIALFSDNSPRFVNAPDLANARSLHVIHTPKLQTFRRRILLSDYLLEPHERMIPLMVPRTVTQLELEIELTDPLIKPIALYNPFPPFGAFQELRHLTLVMCVDDHELTRRQTTLQVLCDFFSQPPTSNFLHLEKVIIQLRALPYVNPSEWNIPAWTTMDTHLASLPNTPRRLKTVDLELRANVDRCVEVNIEEVLPVIRALMPNLSNSGVLNIKASRFI